jgi:hypothetical protein
MPFGFNCKLYVNTATETPYASPTWTEVTTLGDCAVADGREKVNSHTRATGPVATYEPGVLDVSITGKIRVDYGNTAYELLRTNYLAGTPIDILCLDGTVTTNGATGYRFHASVFTWGQDQALTGLLYRDFELAPTAPTVEAEVPKSVKVTSGAPVYTAIT